MKKGLCLLSLLLLPGLAAIQFAPRDGAAASAHDVTASRSRQEAPARQPVTVKATGRGNPWANLRDGREAPVVYTGDVELTETLRSGQARPLALAAGDFDEDGLPDLLAGYSSPGGGLVALQRGDSSAIYPASTEARQRQAAGEFAASPFLPTAPAAPDFIVTGDFDADGHWDAAVAARGGAALYLLAGDGRGTLGPARRVELPGNVTAVMSGDVNRRDGLTDIVVAVAAPAGPRALVFESPAGALRGTPESFNLPAAATALTIAPLDSDPHNHSYRRAVSGSTLVARRAGR